MRLNRVLQLTAGVAISMAATVFTISCGEDGSDGANGPGCTISGSGVPYTVTCGGIEVGLLDGEPGEPGEPGTPGATGEQGKSCSLTPSGISYTVSCGGSVQGTLSGCVAISNGREATIDCGLTKVSLCDNEVFDPSENYCPVSGTAEAIQYCGGIEDERDSVAFNPSKQYCGFKDSAAFVAKTPTVLDLCRNLTTQGISTSAPNPAIWKTADSEWQLASWNSGTSVWEVAAAQNWKNQYCRVALTRTVNGTGASAKIVETKAASDPETCNGKAEKPNNGTWKGEYCGYSSATAKSKSIVTSACGDGTTPNDSYWEEKYCAIADTLTQLTSATEDYCGPTLRKITTSGSETVVWSKRVKINASTVQGILPAGSYKGEYCGYTLADFRKTLAGITDTLTAALKTSGANDTLYLSRITSGACTQEANPTASKTIFNIGPNAKDAYNFGTNGTTAWLGTGGAQPIWLAQYCQGFDPDVIKATKPAPTALPTENNYTDFCTIAADVVLPLDGKLPSILSTNKASNKVNEGSWKNEYCAYNSLNDYGTGNPSTAPTTGRKVTRVNKQCDDLKRPNEALVANYTGALDYWKNEFCAPDGSGKTKLVGITLSSGRMTTLFSVFCPVDTNVADAASYLAKLQGLKKANMLDSNSAEKKEYCGFASKTDMYKQKSGTPTGTAWAATNADPKFSKLTTICDEDGTATNPPKGYPNEAGFTLGSNLVKDPVDVTELNNFYWKNEFCQYQGTRTVKVGLTLTASGSALRDVKDLSKYCPGDTSFVIASADQGNASYIAKFQNNTSSGPTRVNNSSSNLKQYCGFQNYGNYNNIASSTAGTTTEPQFETGKVRRHKFTLLTTRCGDDKGVNAAMDDDGTKRTSWNNEYCQADESSRGVTKRVGGTGNYCGEDIDITKTGLVRLNENSWQGEYCFDDFKKAKCLGGQIPLPGALSTSPDAERCAF